MHCYCSNQINTEILHHAERCSILISMNSSFSPGSYKLLKTDQCLASSSSSELHFFFHHGRPWEKYNISTFCLVTQKQDLFHFSYKNFWCLFLSFRNHSSSIRNLIWLSLKFRRVIFSTRKYSTKPLHTITVYWH